MFLITFPFQFTASCAVRQFGDGGNTISPEQVKEISGYLDTWEEVDFDDKRRVVDLMISAIYATSESINIVWKI